MSNNQETKNPPAYEMQTGQASEIQYAADQTRQAQPYPAQPGAVYTMPGQPAGIYHPAMPGQLYIAAIPINTLSRSSAPVDCPVCRNRVMTKVTFESGSTTHVWAFVLCLCACIGCIPYLMESTKDVIHHCSSCGALLATWHRSGSLEVHQPKV